MIGASERVARFGVDRFLFCVGCCERSLFPELERASSVGRACLLACTHRIVFSPPCCAALTRIRRSWDLALPLLPLRCRRFSRSWSGEPFGGRNSPLSLSLQNAVFLTGAPVLTKARPARGRFFLSHRIKPKERERERGANCND